LLASSLNVAADISRCAQASLNGLAYNGFEVVAFCTADGDEIVVDIAGRRVSTVDRTGGSFPAAASSPRR
jgi:hypothetical protein